MAEIQKIQRRNLRRLLLRSLNKNQFIIIEALKEDRNTSINSFLTEISEEKNISLSTLKLNLKILKELGLVKLIETSEFKRPKLTRFGKSIADLLLPYSFSNQPHLHAWPLIHTTPLAHIILTHTIQTFGDFYENTFIRRCP